MLASCSHAVARSRLLLGSLLFYGVLSGGALLWGVGGVHVGSMCGENLPGVSLLLSLLLAVLISAAYLAVTAWFLNRTRWGRVMAREMAVSLAGLGLGGALVLALASGVAEELFFRGALQPRIGWGAASLLFGALHIPHRREFLLWPVFAGLAGAAFGALYNASGSLLGPIVSHVLINFVGLVRLVCGETNSRLGPEGASDDSAT